MMLQDDFAALIAGIEQTGMTRSEISSIAGISRTTVWRMAVGEYSNPSHKTVSRLEKIYLERAAVTDLKQR